MTDFGAFLLMFVAVIAAVGLVKGLSLLTLALEHPKVARTIERVAPRYVKAEPRQSGDFEHENDTDSPATTIATRPANIVAITQNEQQKIVVQAKAEALAAMVQAGKIGETEGIKLAFGCSPSSTNPKYLAARDALKAELAKLQQPQYRDLVNGRPVLKER